LGKSIVSLALVLLTIGCQRRPQTRESLTKSHEGCRSAAAQVMRGAESFTAFATLGWCDETGPRSIATRWRYALPDDSLALRAFLFASGNLRDGRVFEAAYKAAIDSGRPRHERGAALLVLAAHSVSFPMQVGPQSGAPGVPWRASLSDVADGMTQPGTRPLPLDARQRTLELVQAVTAGQPSALARRADPLYEASTAAYYALQRRSDADGKQR
jgi:hypothetical protein